MEKIISFQIAKSKREFVRYQEDRGPYFYDKLHQHPQCQLTVILEGSGQFLSGDYVGRFQGGDVFFLGENAPHVFRSDGIYFEGKANLSVAGNTVFFDFEAIKNGLLNLDELHALNRFRDFAGLCFQVQGTTAQQIQEVLQSFKIREGLQRFQAALALLNLLEQAGEELQQLNSGGRLLGLSEKDGSRMDRVMQYVLAHRFQKITLGEVAAEANLTKEAFCRFFKLRTRKTFTDYLLHLRINEAQQLLQETELGISEIAYRVGFENLSYFNRSFKRIAGKTPRAVRG
uniref:AraC family transcriptional regulator n=3 Tax=Algoriphagus sp. TaxID=1872435 RepID=UPI004047DF25